MAAEKQKFEKDYFIGGNGTVYTDYGKDAWIEVNYRIVLSLIKKFKRKGKLLEIGFGYGHFLRMAEKDFETYGIEISKFGCNMAKEVTPNSKIYCGDASEQLDKLPKFEVILGHNSLPNMKDPELCIQKCHTHLENKGVFVMRVPNLSSIQYLWSVLSGKKFYAYHDHTNVSIYTKKKWGRILSKTGFKYKIYTYVPSSFLKKMLANSRLAIMPSFMHNLNLTQTIVYVCWK